MTVTVSADVAVMPAIKRSSRAGWTPRKARARGRQA